MKTHSLFRLVGSSLLIWGLLSTEQVLAQISWDRPEKIVRVEKPDRTPLKPRPKPKIIKKKPVIVETAPLLALRWSVRKGDKAVEAPDPTKMPKPANPENTFPVGQHLQLAITVNQTGYLYIIQESDLTMIFPDARINSGKNLVEKNKQIVIPSNCDPKIPNLVDKNGQCWFEVAAEDDDLTLIFSRDRIDNLPNFADARGTTVVKKEVLEQIKKGTSQQFSKTNPDAVTVQFTNLNKTDNEELIIETKIKHQ